MTILTSAAIPPRISSVGVSEVPSEEDVEVGV
jgi:hypothetical protein